MPSLFFLVVNGVYEISIAPLPLHLEQIWAAPSWQVQPTYRPVPLQSVHSTFTVIFFAIMLSSFAHCALQYNKVTSKANIIALVTFNYTTFYVNCQKKVYFSCIFIAKLIFKISLHNVFSILFFLLVKLDSYFYTLHKDNYYLT